MDERHFGKLQKTQFKFGKKFLINAKFYVISIDKNQLPYFRKPTRVDTEHRHGGGEEGATKHVPTIQWV